MGLLDDGPAPRGYGRCITCLWAAATPYSSLPQLECRRHAPFAANRHTGREHEPVWPWVEPSHSCGDYQPRPPA